ncbi:dihydrolipoamide acetyltransferase family protein [Tumebacillus lipolyticus]|uniref:Dihydrolipoamide acetyltransferase component of pyruvate dehydrogenase complex n=1 Tax=Tumebacillus lipolyticus TaxID=1280370 RepID=A0ABW5A1Z7_9BACL
MAVSFKLPDIGEGIHEAEVVRWLVQEGDQVREFDPLVEVQTDKALVELPSPLSGQVREIKAKAGELARVGEVLVILGEAEAVQEQADRAEVISAPILTAGRVLATPAVRQLARDLMIDIRLVSGSGAAGRVTKEDLLAHQRAQQEQRLSDAERAEESCRSTAEESVRSQALPSIDTMTPTTTRVPLRGLRRTIAERMTKAAFTAPHVTSIDEVDMTELVSLRRRMNKLLEPSGQKITYLPFLLKALLIALKEHPYLNAQLDDERGEIVLRSDYNIGIAIDTPDGLIVPVLKGAERRSLLELATEIGRLIELAKRRALAVEEMRGGTITISNMGPLGGLFATPILNYPEVAILGVHAMQEKAVVYQGEIAIRTMMYLSLSFDHRVIDGAEAVRFTNRIKRLLEHPDLLVLEMG